MKAIDRVVASISNVVGSAVSNRQKRHAGDPTNIRVLRVSDQPDDRPPLVDLEVAARSVC